MLDEAEKLLETNLEQAKVKAEQGLAIYASLLEEINRQIEISQTIDPLFIIIPIVVIIAIIILFFGLTSMKNRGKGNGTGPSATKTVNKNEKVSWDKDTPL